MLLGNRTKAPNPAPSDKRGVALACHDHGWRQSVTRPRPNGLHPRLEATSSSSSFLFVDSSVLRRWRSSASMRSECACLATARVRMTSDRESMRSRVSCSMHSRVRVCFRSRQKRQGADRRNPGWLGQDLDGEGWCVCVHVCVCVCTHVFARVCPCQYEHS